MTLIWILYKRTRDVVRYALLLKLRRRNDVVVDINCFSKSIFLAMN
jgi:hypothetical protein